MTQLFGGSLVAVAKLATMIDDTEAISTRVRHGAVEGNIRDLQIIRSRICTINS